MPFFQKHLQGIEYGEVVSDSASVGAYVEMGFFESEGLGACLVVLFEVGHCALGCLIRSSSVKVS